MIKIFNIKVPPKKNVVDLLVTPMSTDIQDSLVLYNFQDATLKGKLYIIPAIMNEDPGRLGKIMWGDFHASDNFREKLYHFEVNSQIDYFFIDSRSGQSSNAFFINLKADVIVMYSRIDGQGQDGTRTLLELFRNNGLDTPFVIVCSSIPHHPSASQPLVDYDNAIRSVINKGIDIQIPYNAALAVKEQIVFRADNKEEFETVISNYKDLAGIIMESANEDE